MGEPWML